jgi:hypothetical protein
MLFELEQPKDDSPIERLNITYIQLYYDEKQLQQFKQLCKRGMMKMHPTTYQQQNISDFIFEILKLYNADIK